MAFNFFDIEKPAYTEDGTVFGMQVSEPPAASASSSVAVSTAPYKTVAGEEMSARVQEGDGAPRGKPIIAYEFTGVVLYTSTPPGTDNPATNYTIWISQKVRNGSEDGSVIKGIGQSIGDYVVSYPVEEMNAKDRADKARLRNGGGGIIAVKRDKVDGVFINLRVGTVLTFRVSRIITSQISSGSFAPSVYRSSFARRTVARRVSNRP